MLISSPEHFELSSKLHEYCVQELCHVSSAFITASYFFLRVDCTLLCTHLVRDEDCRSLLFELYDLSSRNYVRVLLKAVS